jgi:hypothetical protein
MKSEILCRRIIKGNNNIVFKKFHIFISIVFIFKLATFNTYAQEIQNVKIKNLETILNRYISRNIYIGISDPNLKKEEGIVQSTERAYLTFALLNGFNIEAVNNRYVEDIYEGENNSFKENNELVASITFSGESNLTFNILQRLYISSSGECITFIERGEVGKPLTFSGTVNITHINNIDGDNTSASVNYEYAFENTRYNENYSFEMPSNGVKGTYHIKSTGTEKQINVQQVLLYKELLEQKKNLQYSSHTSDLTNGLWKAFINCLLNDSYRIVKVKTVTDIYTDDIQKGGVTVFHEKFEQQAQFETKYQIAKVIINGFYFSEFGMNLNLMFEEYPDYINVDESKQDKLEINYDQLRFEQIFNEEMEKLSKENK